MERYRMDDGTVVDVSHSNVCSQSDDESDDVAVESNRNPNDPFWLNHPYTGETTVSDQRTYRTPWRAWDADALIIWGTADATELQALANGSGYAPFTTEIRGKKRGVVRLYSMSYRDTDSGPYREVIFGFDAYETNDKEPRVFPWVNSVSTLVPAYHPENVLFTGELILTKQPPITLGRELLGYNKHIGKISRRNETSIEKFTQTLKFDDVVAHLWIDTSQSGQRQVLMDVASAFGLSDPSQLPPPHAEVKQLGVTWDAMNPTQLKRIIGYVVWTPEFSAWNAEKETLDIGAKSEMGKLLNNIQFTPSLVGHSSRFKLSIDVQ